MKNFLIVLAVTFLSVSCSSSDDNNDNNSSQLNPPNWIQGTWARVYTDTDIVQPFCRFTSDKFCTITSGLETCLMGSKFTTVNQTASESNYSFSFTTQGQTSSFEFLKISSTKIELVSPNEGFPNVPLEKQ